MIAVCWHEPDPVGKPPDSQHSERARANAVHNSFYRGYLDKKRCLPDVWDIVEPVAEKHGLTMKEIMEHTRRSPIVYARQEAWWHLQKAGILRKRVVGFFGLHYDTIRYGAKEHEKRMKGTP